MLLVGATSRHKMRYNGSWQLPLVAWRQPFLFLAGPRTPGTHCKKGAYFLSVSSASSAKLG